MKFLYEVTTRIEDMLDVRSFNVVAESGPLALKKVYDYMKNESEEEREDEREAVDEIKKIAVIDIE